MTITHPALRQVGSQGLWNWMRRPFRRAERSPQRATGRPQLPQELQGAEDWLLDDLGLPRRQEHPSPPPTLSLRKQG